MTVSSIGDARDKLDELAGIFDPTAAGPLEVSIETSDAYGVRYADGTEEYYGKTPVGLAAAQFEKKRTAKNAPLSERLGRKHPAVVLTRKVTVIRVATEWEEVE